MNIKRFKRFAVFTLLLVIIGYSTQWAYAQGGDDLSGESLSTIGLRPPIILVNDPDLQNIRIPSAIELNDLNAASATFVIDYVANGGTDPWGETCLDFPANAKTAFAAAAEIWANKISSTVPIAISACWADLGDGDTLGYSAGGSIHKNFANAPLADTWYSAALANSIAETDLAPNGHDMYITYNTNFAWYYGTDANPPAGTYDLVTVAAHEIAHGLEFGGSAFVASGIGYYGYSYDGYPPYYPSVYDTFIETGAGTKLTSYTDGTTDLANVLQSNDLWFDGTNANANNGNARVKIYAPTTWLGGSSYSHLDYATFANTEHNMMVYAIGSGSANHNPGVVTLGLFDDLGWDVVYPPANDNFNNAISVALPAGLKDSRFTGGATTAQSDPEINACGITGKGKGSVWYKYAPGTNETVSFNTDGSTFEDGSTFTPYIVIWDGEATNSLSFVACGRGNVAFQATGGNVYHLEVITP